MKKAYASPRITIEQFAPNEYVAACAEGVFNDGGGLVVCDGSSHDKCHPHGFIVGPEDAAYITDGQGSLGIYSCPFVYVDQKKAGENCTEYEPGDAHDLDISADDIAKEENALGAYVWYDLSFKEYDKRGDPIFNVGALSDVRFDTYTAS